MFSLCERAGPQAAAQEKIEEGGARSARGRCMQNICLFTMCVCVCVCVIGLEYTCMRTRALTAFARWSEPPAYWMGDRLNDSSPRWAVADASRMRGEQGTHRK